MEPIDDKKCYSCGKEFKKADDLRKHKERKTPCLIREVPPDKINDPNRCIYCNKILSKKEHLMRHLKTCKIKNGGMEILVDKVRYEQEIRILKEQAADRDRQAAIKDKRAEDQIKELINRVHEQDQCMMALLKDVKEMKTTMEASASAIIPAAVTTKNKMVNSHNINNNNNTVNINAPTIVNNHFHINNYDEPNTDGLIFSMDEIGKHGKLLELSLQKLYFNPDKPENHSLYVSNKKEGDIVAFRNGWELHQLQQAVEVAIVAMKKASDVSMNNCMHYEKDNGREFLAASPTAQSVIRDFTKSINDLPLDMLDIERHPTDSFYKIAISNRAVVLQTIKDSGCKLIK